MRFLDDEAQETAVYRFVCWHRYWPLFPNGMCHSYMTSALSDHDIAEALKRLNDLT